MKIEPIKGWHAYTALMEDAAVPGGGLSLPPPSSGPVPEVGSAGDLQATTAPTQLPVMPNQTVTAALPL